MYVIWHSGRSKYGWTVGYHLAGQVGLAFVQQLRFQTYQEAALMVRYLNGGDKEPFPEILSDNFIAQ